MNEIRCELAIGWINQEVTASVYVVEKVRHRNRLLLSEKREIDWAEDGRKADGIAHIGIGESVSQVDRLGRRARVFGEISDLITDNRRDVLCGGG